MRGFIGFTKRNMMLYFKDLQAVIFSLLTSIIIFVLYLLFLKGTFVGSIEGAMMGLEEIVDRADVKSLVNGLLLVGIMGSAMITIPYNCLTTIVRDREHHIDCDIASTPLGRWQIILSYFLSAAASAFLMTAAILTIGLMILSAMGEMYLDVRAIVCLYGEVAMGSVSATAFFMIILLLFRSTSASGAFFGILSAAAGFVIGAYIPISQFSNGVQTVCNLFPASHITVLFRNSLLQGILEHMDGTLQGLDGGEFVRALEEIFSFRAFAFGNMIEPAQSVLYIMIAIVVCVGIMIPLYSKTYKRK